MMLDIMHYANYYFFPKKTVGGGGGIMTLFKVRHFIFLSKTKKNPSTPIGNFIFILSLHFLFEFIFFT